MHCSHYWSVSWLLTTVLNARNFLWSDTLRLFKKGFSLKYAPLALTSAYCISLHEDNPLFRTTPGYFSDVFQAILLTLLKKVDSDFDSWFQVSSLGKISEESEDSFVMEWLCARWVHSNCVCREEIKKEERERGDLRNPGRDRSNH